MKLLMVNLMDVERSFGGVGHQLGLLKRWVSQGHEVVVLVPRRASTSALSDELASNFCFSWSVRKAGMPAILDTILQIPFMVRFRALGFKTVYTRVNSLTFFLTLVARLLGMKVIAEHNSWLASERRLRSRSPLAVWLDRYFQIAAARLANRSRCVTEGLANLLIREGVPPAKLVVIGNGTDLEQFYPMDREEALEKMNLDPSKLWLGFIGLLARWQGVSCALEALSLLNSRSDIALLIAGDGPERPVLEERAMALGISDRVHFLGHVPKEAANLVVNCFDVALAPFTRDRNEEIGLSAIKIRDYAAAGRMVLASDVAGIRELGSTNWLHLHDADDAASLAQRIEELASKDWSAPSARLSARRYAEKNFDWRVLADKLMVEINSVG